MHHIFNIVWWWFEVRTGTVDEAGPYYAWWSGFGSDISEIIAPLVILYTVYRRNKCVSCHRIVLKGGLGKVEGTHYETCHKHTNMEDHIELQKRHQKLHPRMHAHMNQVASDQ